MNCGEEKHLLFVAEQGGGNKCVTKVRNKGIKPGLNM